MEAVTRGERIYFGAVGLLALWVGTWGFFMPTRVDVALPFVIPPLHARFVGALYLSGLVLMVGSVLARRWTDVSLVPLIIAVWTGGLLIVSLVHPDLFRFGARVAIWFAAYISYPLIALGLLWRHRNFSAPRPPGRPFPGWGRAYLLVQGVVVTALAAALVLATGRVVDAWPWPIAPLVAQIYSAPLLSYGLASLALSRRRTWTGVSLVVGAMLVFAVGTLVASTLHRELFSSEQLGDRLWFGAFTLAAVMLAAITLRGLAAARRPLPG